MELLKSQKAEVFEFLKNHGFDYSRLHFGEIISPNSGVVRSLLTVKCTRLNFRFDQAAGSRIVEYSPGEENLVHYQEVFDSEIAILAAQHET